MLRPCGLRLRLRFGLGLALSVSVRRLATPAPPAGLGLRGGLLSDKMYGPSVFPYQPEGIWDVPYSSDRWIESKGEDRYRRAIYTFIRRSAPYPSLVTYDAPSREFCTIRRVRTNTPLQALTTPS